MSAFYETSNFEAVAAGQPFISREEGGHVIIFPKEKSIGDRTQLSPKLAIEYAYTIMLVAEAFTTAMNNVGVPIIRINYAELGNGAYRTGEPPLMHMHILGRVDGSKKQAFPDAPYMSKTIAPTPDFFDKFEPLKETDVAEIVKQITRLEKTDKYLPHNWGLAR